MGVMKWAVEYCHTSWLGYHINGESAGRTAAAISAFGQSFLKLSSNNLRCSASLPRNCSQAIANPSPGECWNLLSRQGTRLAIKLVRLCSNLLKVARCFALTKNLKVAERLGLEIGQLRRLLRVDRFCLVVRDYVESVRKEEMSGVDWFMVGFRALLLLEDCSDMLAYLIQMGVINGRKGLGLLRQRVADCYFLECIGWLGLYSYQLLKAKEEDRPKKATIVLRYLLDSLTSHNDFSSRIHTLDPRLSSLLGLLSSLLNLCLIWQ